MPQARKYCHPDISEDCSAEEDCDKGAWKTCGVAILLAVFQGWWLYAVTQDAIDLAFFAYMHLLAMAVALVWLWVAKSIHSGERIALLHAISVATLGVIGSAGTALSGILMIRLQKKSRSFLDWYLTLFPSTERDAAEELYRHVSKQEHDDEPKSLVTFLDYLSKGSVQQKIAVLTLLGNHYRAMFAPALQLACKDADPTVRVMAASVTAKLEGLFTGQVQELSKKIAASPAQSELWLQRARLYDDYAFTGLLDPEREAQNRREAESGYQRCLSDDAENIAALVGLGRLYVRTARYAKAAELFSRARLLRPAQLDLSLWLMESYFKTGDYDRVRELADEIGEACEETDGVLEEVKLAVSFWQREVA